WEHGGPCAMVGAGRETPNGVCISAVYTPPQCRRRGYASIATAELSQRLLDSGKRFCCLYTDIDYPTSNAIYHAIGYTPVQDALDIAFP
ncbi:MAG: GNAT family N-acetyltransferase, partial [Gammaproteobacteria bacterium]|nr:GNAT family N-acetyltransferase [Gammaproteobacteria bacterium]